MKFGQCAVMSATVRGVDVVPVTVEVVVSGGLPGISIVGMPDAAIQEARERVRAALRAGGFTMPDEKIVVNLAPSSLKKTGSGFDLPIALGILAASRLIRLGCAIRSMWASWPWTAGFATCAALWPALSAPVPSVSISCAPPRAIRFP